MIREFLILGKFVRIIGYLGIGKIRLVLEMFESKELIDDVVVLRK